VTDSDPNGYKCPYTGFKKRCVDMRAQCPKWVHLLGRHPQTSAPVDQWDCADRWLPLLIIEAASETRGAAAAIESFRNEMVRQGEIVLALPQARAIGRGRPVDGGGRHRG